MSVNVGGRQCTNYYIHVFNCNLIGHIPMMYQEPVQLVSQTLHNGLAGIHGNNQMKQHTFG